MLQKSQVEGDHSQSYTGNQHGDWAWVGQLAMWWGQTTPKMGDKKSFGED